MAVFLYSQLDFIFFFYGLAFVLLGAVCFAIVRAGQPRAWAMLGLFGLVHGAGEWLDLVALVIGDSPAFAVIRTAGMAASYVFLIEFARLVSIQLGWKMPGRWIYLLLLSLVVLAGVANGLTTAHIVARYALGFVGAMATSLVFARCAKELAGKERRLAITTAVVFALYALAAGLITPRAPFWPASVFNYQGFLDNTGIPIQLVRGSLASCAAYLVWAIWGEKRISDMASERYTRDVQKQFARTLATMATILVSGWALTEYLGMVYEKHVEAYSRGDVDLLASRLTRETGIIDVMAKTVAGAPSVQALFTEGKTRGGERMLDLAVEVSGAEHGEILDRTGTVVATSAARAEAPRGTPVSSTAPYFQKSIAGAPGYHLAFDAARGELDYYASYPITSGRGGIVGVAVLKKSLNAFAAELREYGRVFFLIDPHGIVALTNRPEMMLRSMWPLSADTQSELTRQFGRLNDQPMMEREVGDATWTLVDGSRNYVRRRDVNHSQWSLVILKPTEEIFASRVLGIAITFLMTILILVYFQGRERALHDNVQMDRRLELQELASDLRFRAITDPLTGLSNRLRFDEAIALETSRSQRYGTPLSLVIYDIDHFKAVNDTYGHLAGDKVLIKLSEFVATRIRRSDILARWGGEEFAILLAETDAREALQFADKLRDSIANLAFDEIGSVTCSFGIAQIESGMTVEEFISRADEALYRAKIGGRNRVELYLEHADPKSPAEAAA
jgi:diguanylate cyclase (GGDEF)-like protein